LHDRVNYGQITEFMAYGSGFLPGQQVSGGETSELVSEGREISKTSYSPAHKPLGTGHPEFRQEPSP
jgi:hypothetical protein